MKMRQQMGNLTTPKEIHETKLWPKNSLLSKEAEDELKWIERNVSPSLIDA